MVKKKEDSILQEQGEDVGGEIRDGYNYKSPYCISGTEFLTKKKDIISISPALDIITGGVPLGSYVLLTGDPKCGKGQPLSSIVWTPDGPKQMKDIKIGDIISTPYGRTSNVVGVYPQGQQKIYKITFSDGDSCLCDENHLWKVQKNNHNKDKHERILNLKDLKKDMFFVGRPKWKVKLPQFCHFNKQNIPLDPYLLGLLIGDGGISIKGRVIITNTDEEILSYIKNILFSDYTLKQINNDISYRISRNDHLCRHNNKEHYYLSSLIELGLQGCDSHSKFIPNIYKYNSYDVRLALLQGLMDTDGCITKNGTTTFSTVSRQLALDFKEVAQSLGFLCKISDRITTCNNKKFKSYRLFIRCNDATKLFRISRKKNRTRLRKKPQLCRTIKDIQYLGKEETVCIKTDAWHGMYLTDNFIPTHNTTLSLTIAANAQKIGCPIYYFNIEARLKNRDLQGIHGLSLEEPSFNVIGSYYKNKKTNIMSAEDYLAEAEKIIHNIPRSILIFDSVSLLITKKEIANELDEGGYAPGPALMSKFCKRMSNVIAINDNIIIAILHYTTNMSPTSRKTKQKSGGRKIAYAADVDLEAKYFKYLKNSDGYPIGQEVIWQTLSTSFLPPGQEISSFIRYGYGVDDITELIQLGEDLSIIKKSGAWYSLPFDEEGRQAQGKENLRELLYNNPPLLEKLKSEIYSMVSSH